MKKKNLTAVVERQQKLIDVTIDRAIINLK